MLVRLLSTHTQLSNIANALIRLVCNNCANSNWFQFDAVYANIRKAHRMPFRRLLKMSQNVFIAFQLLSKLGTVHHKRWLKNCLFDIFTLSRRPKSLKYFQEHEAHKRSKLMNDFNWHTYFSFNCTRTFAEVKYFLLFCSSQFQSPAKNQHSQSFIWMRCTKRRGEKQSHNDLDSCLLFVLFFRIYAKMCISYSISVHNAHILRFFFSFFAQIILVQSSLCIFFCCCCERKTE